MKHDGVFQSNPYFTEPVMLVGIIQLGEQIMKNLGGNKQAEEMAKAITYSILIKQKIFKNGIAGDCKSPNV